MHNIIDSFFERIDELSKEDENMKIHNLSYENLELIAYEIIEEKLNLNKNYIFTSTQKFVTLTNRLKKVILQSIKYIVYQIQNSDFNIYRK